MERRSKIINDLRGVLKEQGEGAAPRPKWHLGVLVGVVSAVALGVVLSIGDHRSPSVIDPVAVNNPLVIQLLVDDASAESKKNPPYEVDLDGWVFDDKTALDGVLGGEVVHRHGFDADRRF